MGKAPVLLLPTLDWRIWLEPERRGSILLLPLNLRYLVPPEEQTQIIHTEAGTENQRPRWDNSSSEHWVCTSQDDGCGGRITEHKVAREREPRLLFITR